MLCLWYTAAFHLLFCKHIILLYVKAHDEHVARAASAQHMYYVLKISTCVTHVSSSQAAAWSPREMSEHSSTLLVTPYFLHSMVTTRNNHVQHHKVC